jgi:hypothetical protein
MKTREIVYIYFRINGSIRIHIKPRLRKIN